MFKRFLHSEKGQAMVEFALVLPLLLALLCGIIDFGWLYYNQITLNNAAREGARYAVIHYDPAADWKDAAEDRMIGSMAGVSSAVAIVSDPVEQQITASVTATPRILTGFTSTILGKQTMELHASCTMRLENQSGYPKTALEGDLMKKLKLIALLAAVLVGLGLYRFLQELQKPQEVPHTTVVVAAVDIPENTQITEEMLTLRSISDDSLLADYITDPESVIGMVLTGDLFAGEPVTRARLVRLGETASDRNTLAYMVQPGMRAITIFVDQDTGLVNFLKPGNRVDILANYSHEDTRIVLNEESRLEYVQIPTTHLLAQNITVLAVGSVMDKAGTAEYTAVTLEVTPEDALNLDAVDWWGGLRLLLRSPLDDEIIEVGLVDEKTVYAQGGGA